MAAYLATAQAETHVAIRGKREGLKNPVPCKAELVDGLNDAIRSSRHGITLTVIVTGNSTMRLDEWLVQGKLLHNERVGMSCINVGYVWAVWTD
ncbi:hypothetical protein BB934_08610 [Microvirga ossetica]|uniref:Uncharacterized protein n=1 Tax=Microvirga ossetica TaxID=1882682 RepID=A0A1B2EEA1_9HYPH|nr:hypothetical protein BB934_08610 [Microvirga ossetica]